ncbi:MAG: hypothetical protein LRY51_16620 [Geovibrio sp.]|nr:hypothetical protein [Geovibrio sp.]
MKQPKPVKKPLPVSKKPSAVKAPAEQEIYTETKAAENRPSRTCNPYCGGEYSHPCG